MLSVSATVGTTSSAAIPNVSANCIAMPARDPPMSVDPSTSETFPSEFRVAVTTLFNPMLNQNPLATPRPRCFPDFGVW